MDKDRYIDSYSRIIGLNKNDVIDYALKKGMAALVTNADELLKTSEQREKHKAFLDLYRMSGELDRNNPDLSSSDKLASYMHSVIQNIHDKESFAVVYLDVRLRAISSDIISVGVLNSSLVHPREVFKNAILNKAYAISVCHNHPSGFVNPSKADLDITNRLVDSGKIIGIQLVDHIIIDGLDKSNYYSFRDNSLIGGSLSNTTSKTTTTYETPEEYTSSLDSNVAAVINEEVIDYNAETNIEKPDRNLFARWQLEDLFTKDSDAYYLSVSNDDIETVRELFPDFSFDGKPLAEEGFTVPQGQDRATLKLYFNVARDEYTAEFSNEMTTQSSIENIDELIESIEYDYNNKNTLDKFNKNFENSGTDITAGEEIAYNGKAYTAGFINNQLTSSTKRLYLIPKDNGSSPKTIRFMNTDELSQIVSRQKKSLNLPENEGAGEKLSAKDALGKTLEEGIKDVLNSDTYKKWLNTASKFYKNNYSLRNAILIFKQKPDATYTMGYQAWKDFGRNVAQGAKAAQIFVPVMAYEKSKGSLFRMIVDNLRTQIKQNPEKTAVYKVGTSSLEFTMNKSGRIGLKMNGKESTIFPNDEEVKKFISRYVIGVVPMYYTVSSVFDVKDTIVPEYLWVKSGYKQEEIVRDKFGKPITNQKGEVQIINTPERQAKFSPIMDQTIKEKNPEKMEILYDCLKKVSERNGIPVFEVKRESDEHLKNGADGYFSRDFTSERPKGYIVMPDDLEPTKRCAVLLHEMGHSDLHGNLENLAQKLGVKRVSRKMREIQAESVAYATARQFGIETDTSSFKYLAVFSAGFDLQELQKSLDVVYNECKKLTREIEDELERRNLNLELEEIQAEPLSPEAVKTISTQYSAYALSQGEIISGRNNELPGLAADNRTNTELLDILKDQKSCTDRMDKMVQSIHNNVDKLQSATSRAEQDDIVSEIEALKRSLENENASFLRLSESFSEVSSRTQSLKEEFYTSPRQVINKLKPKYPELNFLSNLQLSYIEKSEYIKKERLHLLNKDVDRFVKEICSRADTLNDVISKNGMFVEIRYCEKWTDNRIFFDGALMHPKCAETIIKQSEAQIRKLREDADKIGDYFPYTKCSLTIFSVSDDKKSFDTYSTRVDIGDGMQNSLSDIVRLEGHSHGNLIYYYKQAISERGIADKIAFNEAVNNDREVSEISSPVVEPRAVSQKEWLESINESKQNAIMNSVPGAESLSKQNEIAKEG